MAIASNVVFSAPTNSENNSTVKTVSDILPQLISNKYPLTKSIVLPDGSLKYRIALISDMDSHSMSKENPYQWISYFKKGYLTYNESNKDVSIEWDQSANKKFTSRLSFGGRGLELSELVTYDGQLLTLDDKTGLIYHIENETLIPWVIVVGGNGHVNKGNDRKVNRNQIKSATGVGDLCICYRQRG